MDGIAEAQFAEVVVPDAGTAVVEYRERGADVTGATDEVAIETMELAVEAINIEGLGNWLPPKHRRPVTRSLKAGATTSTTSS